MASITLWIFDTKEKALNSVEAEAECIFIGPTELGSVLVADRCADSSSENNHYADFEGKWGVAIIG